MKYLSSRAGQERQLGGRLLLETVLLVAVTSCSGKWVPQADGSSTEGGSAGASTVEAGSSSGGGRQGASGASNASGAGAAATTPRAGSGGSAGALQAEPGAGSCGRGLGGSGASDPEPGFARYPGHGFIVHEWGTDTIVVGSDGSLQRGLHHEEEDLPSFVYDRIKAATLIGDMPSPSVTIKMETPVTYFYSDHALDVKAKVEFPKGVFTQWYPNVNWFQPPVAAPGAVLNPTQPAALLDPALDASFPFQSEMCRTRFGGLARGLLDWGGFSIAEPAAPPKAPLASAPLERFGWSYARDVASNLLNMPNGETEKFLFYRGLGDFELPVRVTNDRSGKIQFTNGYAAPIGQVFVLNVDAKRGAFDTCASNIDGLGARSTTVPSLEFGKSLDEYAESLGEAVTAALDATGLYHDEAVAMVNTWRRQWFRTPGVRALYLMPQSWTDQSIPLTIDPQPESQVRVMLIRVELITPEQEAEDVAALGGFDTDSASAGAHFAALGRFAEPRLRRALALSPNAAGEAYLANIARQRSGVMSVE